MSRPCYGAVGGSLWLSRRGACTQSGGMNFSLALPLWLRRSARPRAAPSPTLELLAGQRRDIALATGDGLRVAAGELVLLRPARWLADALVAPAALVLREGDTWTSVERESVTLVGNEACRVTLRRR
jgi:hypothetical protein